MQDQVDRFAEKAAGTDFEVIAANVAAAWEAVRAEIDMRVAGIDLAMNMLTITKLGLEGMSTTSTSLVAST